MKKKKKKMEKVRESGLFMPDSMTFLCTALLLNSSWKLSKTCENTNWISYSLKKKKKKKTQQQQLQYVFLTAECVAQN